jgi:hypothetical protein
MREFRFGLPGPYLARIPTGHGMDLVHLIIRIPAGHGMDLVHLFARTPTGHGMDLVRLVRGLWRRFPGIWFGKVISRSTALR